MREIKFRAWVKSDEFNPEGMYGSFKLSDIVQGRMESNIFCENSPPIQEPNWDKIILMQYTGLKDKSGREIYEGDIVRDKTDNYYIEYLKGSFCFIPIYAMKDNTMKWEYKKALSEYWEDMAHDTEIIGNRFENPELLESKRDNKCKK
jgi:uncharacterized phage protein (TIGR01671 family)